MEKGLPTSSPRNRLTSASSAGCCTDELLGGSFTARCELEWNFLVITAVSHPLIWQVLRFGFESAQRPHTGLS
jgi:hypothetical protein